MYLRRISIFPFAVVLWILIPILFSSPSLINLFVFWFLTAIQAIGLSLLFGYAGQVSMGQAAFYGIGSYTTAVLSVKVGLPGFVGIVLAVLVSAAIGYALARPVLRLKGYYLAMSTAAFGLIIYNVFGQWSSVTGGHSGIAGIPTLSLLGFSFSSPISFYYLVGAVMIVVLMGSRKLISTGPGRAMRSLRESEAAAQAFGIDAAQLKAKVFSLAAGLSGLAGALYAFYSSYISPDSFTFDSSINLLLALVVGGIGSIWGAVIGSGLLTFLPEWLYSLKHAYGLVFGMAVIIILVINPNGLYGLALAGYRRYANRKRQE